MVGGAEMKPHRW